MLLVFFTTKAALGVGVCDLRRMFRPAMNFINTEEERSLDSQEKVKIKSLCLQDVVEVPDSARWGIFKRYLKS